jgi:hypothetical protein
MIMWGRAPSEALTRSLLTDGHFLRIARALKSIRQRSRLTSGCILAMVSGVERLEKACAQVQAVGSED